MVTSAKTLRTLIASLPQRFSAHAGGYAPARSSASAASVGSATAAQASAPTPIVLPDGVPADGHYDEVDVAIVMESTYPYLKGGVSAVVHDIITGNPDLSYGIIHIAWDRESPLKDLYGMPGNVRWVKVIYLSMTEHPEFTALRPSDLHMNHSQRLVLAKRLVGAMHALADGDVDPMWELIGEGMAASTRRYQLTALLGTSEFMEVYRKSLPSLDMPLAELFWCLRDFFSLAHAVLGETMPRARVYHAHTTGYAALLAANAARENDGSYLLTEHNLYVRDTVNTLLDRRMDKKVTLKDYRTFEVTGRERMWMAWWLEMGRLCYPDAYATTYLYKLAVVDAVKLGTDPSKAHIIPNGIVPREFDGAYAQRLADNRLLLQTGAQDHVWRLVYIARVVPIKGLLDLIESMRILRERGVRFHLDVCGPTEHMPDYFDQCADRIAELGLGEEITIRGTIKVRECLNDWDLFLLPSYNEGLPCVSLETMGAGIPTVSTDVGAVRPVVEEDIVAPDGSVWGPCGFVIEPGDPLVMADRVQEVTSDVELFEQMSLAARGRAEVAYSLLTVNAAYHDLYVQGGAVGSHPVPEALEGQTAAQEVRESVKPVQDGVAAGPATPEPGATQVLPSVRALDLPQEDLRELSLVP